MPMNYINLPSQVVPCDKNILNVVQYQNIDRNLPLYRKGVQESWEELCVAGTVIDVC